MQHFLPLPVLLTLSDTFPDLASTCPVSLWIPFCLGFHPCPLASCVTSDLCSFLYFLLATNVASQGLPTPFSSLPPYYCSPFLSPHTISLTGVSFLLPLKASTTTLSSVTLSCSFVLFTRALLCVLISARRDPNNELPVFIFSE